MENTQSDTQTKNNKRNLFDKIIDKFGLYILFVAMVFVLFFFLLKEAEAYPFGKNTIANYDYSAQIAPFFENFYYFFEGKTSLFYVKNTLGGIDMFQSVCFMFLSPFTFVIFLFGKGNSYQAMSFLLPLKISCIGCSALFYMKKRFPRLNSLVSFGIAIIYSVCGYVGTSNTYVNWMDFLIYMPLVAWGFKVLIDTRKVKLHAIMTACMIYTCFSISCFSLFLIFPIYFVYILILVDKDKRKEKATDTVVSLLYAILASLPVLVPVLISSSHSSRNVSLFGMLNDDISNDIDHTYVKLTYILADTFLLIFGLMAIIKNRKTKLGRFLIIGELIILAPILIDGSCYLLNAGSYNHYAMRFGFLNGFASMYTCCIFFENTDFSESLDYVEPAPSPEPTEEDGKEKKQLTFKETLCSYKPIRIFLTNLKNKKFYLSLVAIGLFAFITCYFTYYLKVIFDNANTLYSTVDTDRSDNNFISHYSHSEGGFNVIAWIFLLALILVIIATLLVKKKIVYPKIISVILCIFAIGQSTFMYGTLINGNLASQGNYEVVDKMIDCLEENEEDYPYYRIAEYKSYVSTNIGISKNLKIFSGFSSNIDITNFKTAYNLNYVSHSGGSNGVDSGSKSFFGSCLLGSRYLLIHQNDNKAEIEEEKSDGTKVKKKQNNPINMEYFAKIYSIPDTAFEIYENKYALPTCFTFTANSIPDDLNSDDWFESMQSLFNFLGGEGELFLETEVGVSKNKNGDWEIQSQIDYEGEYFVKIDFPSDYKITLGGSTLESNKHTYGYSFKNKGYYWPSVIDCTNKTLDEDTIKAHVSCLIIEPQKMKTLHDNATANIVRYQETKTGVNFTIDNASDNEYVFLSNVVLDASKVTINGKKAQFIENKSGLMIFKLQSGKNTVKTSYTSPYPMIALVCAFVSALLIVGLTVVRRRTKFLNNKHTQKVLYYTSFALSGVLVIFFIILPFVLFIQKAFLNVNIGRFITKL